MNPNGLMIGNGLNRMVNNTAWTDLLKKSSGQIYPGCIGFIIADLLNSGIIIGKFISINKHSTPISG